MVVKKVENIVVGVRIEGGENILKILRKEQGVKKIYLTRQRKYFRGSAINYPKIFSTCF